MRGRGYTTTKGRQVHISVYLPVGQYSSLRAATKKTGLSIQQLIRHSLDQLLKDMGRASFDASAIAQSDPVTKAGVSPSAERAVAAHRAYERVLARSLAAVRSSQQLLRKASKT